MLVEGGFTLAERGALPESSARYTAGGSGVSAGTKIVPAYRKANGTKRSRGGRRREGRARELTWRRTALQTIHAYQRVSGS